MLCRGSFSKPCLRTFSSVFNMDVLQTVKVPLPNQPEQFVNFRYYDSAIDFENDKNNDRKNEKILLASHGCPGSHKDFKYMVPQLVEYGFRVIAFNWPGFGISDNISDKTYHHQNHRRMELLKSFVNALNLTKIDAVIGHSAGCYPLPLLFTKNPEFCSNAFFIAPGSATPYQAIRPYWLIQWFASLLNYNFLYKLVCGLTYFITSNMLDFKYKDYKHAGGLVRVVANIDFPTLNRHVSIWKDSKIPPVVLFLGATDAVVEKAKSLEYAERLGCGEIVKIAKGDEKVSEIFHNFQPPVKLARHRAILFEGEGHFIQKHRGDAICKLISEIVEKR